MFTEKQLYKYADVLLWGLKIARKKKSKKNDIVVIRYNMPAIRLAEILYEKLMEMGRNPVQRMIFTPVMEKKFFELSNNQQLVFQPPGEEEFLKCVNGSIYLHAPESITHLRGANPAKISKTTLARKRLRDILNKRDETGDFGWTLCTYPTDELALHANMTKKEYANQIIRACFLNKKDPVREWQEVYKQALKIKKWLNNLKIKTLHVESRHIDLEIVPGKQRKWIGISGHNIPSFEIFTSPDWRGTRGTYYANQPSYRSGNIVKEIFIKFKKGSAIDIEAKEGEVFTQKQLTLDKGANKIGEFSLTDKRFSKINKFMANTLFDENFGGKYGNCHIALGSSYSDTYAGDPSKLTKRIKNALGFNDSALHWDIVNTEKKRVTAHLVSGKRITIYENGQFCY